MTVHKVRAAVLAGLAIALTGAGVGLVVVAGADPGTTTPTPAPTVTETTKTPAPSPTGVPGTSPTQASPTPPDKFEAPTVETLQATLTRATSKRAADRHGAVQGDSDEFQLSDPHPKAPDFVYTVVKVRPEGDSRAIGIVTTTVNGELMPSEGEVPFVRVGNSWKVEKAWVCTIVAAMDRPAKSC
ncbi:hypothetical protein [Nocardia fluminea]|uniref:hypothetical protein n=1 Tax=Nocardia fluminea TaxID=134984 RepID=UPI0036609380